MKLYLIKLRSNFIKTKHDFHTVDEVKKEKTANYGICANRSHVFGLGGKINQIELK